MDRIKRLRWQQRSLPDDVRQNLSPSEIEVCCTSCARVPPGMRMLTTSCQTTKPKHCGVLCQQWFKLYDQLLSGYMRKDTGVGMDLTLVCLPPCPACGQPHGMLHSTCACCRCMARNSNASLASGRMRRRQRARTPL